MRPVDRWEQRPRLAVAENRARRKGLYRAERFHFDHEAVRSGVEGEVAAERIVAAWYVGCVLQKAELLVRDRHADHARRRGEHALGFRPARSQHERLFAQLELRIVGGGGVTSTPAT